MDAWEWVFQNEQVCFHIIRPSRGADVITEVIAEHQPLDDPTIPPTNNSSEQALRWSVIFRKVTNGFRSDWGRDLFAAVRSIVNTGRRQGFSAFESILIALNPVKSLFALG